MSPFIQAQDYIITNKGDTIKGRVSFLMVGKMEQANLKGESKATFSPISVREVFMRNERYKPVQHAGEIQFMKILRDGYLSYLSFRLQGGQTYDGRLLHLRDGRAIEIATIGFKKQMNNFLLDCPAIMAQIENGELSRNDIEKIVDGYNACIEKVSSARVEKAVTTSNNKSKLDILQDLMADVSKSDLSNKDDLIDMLNDAGEKINQGKKPNNYLIKILKQSLAANAEWLSKFESVLQ